ncbi:MAG TPA: RsmE family RNA methyltransferase [Rhabdochlamydiaceae bacterium]|nr:RsmE family RNA methyltransferase [Rhabdochlamydiaceae bacterium]
MPENRFFTEAKLEKAEQIELTSEEFRHLQVMRRGKNDEIELVDGKGCLAKGTIAELSKHAATIQINEVYKEPLRSKRIILIQALVRQSSLDYIIEKGTELGASEFWLFPAVFSEKKELSSGQKQRLKNLTISALKQCGTLYLPAIYEKEALQKWAPFSGQKFFGDVRFSAPSFSKSTIDPKEEIYFFIGPEKGFADPELKLFETTLKAHGVKLHDNILRVDTAALAAIYLSYLL